MSLLGLSRGKVTYLRGFILGSSLVYGLLVLKGYAPLWFGPENPRWSKKQWSKSAQSCMEELENNKDYSCYKIQPSTRNFITVHESTEERRIRYVYYFSRKFKRLIGIIHFGADCEGPPRSVHGGCSAAIIDAACGVCAILSSVTPHVTANLNVNYRAKIPLGITVKIICETVKTEGKKLYVSFKMIALNQDLTYVEGSALFCNALKPGKTARLPPILSLNR